MYRETIKQQKLKFWAQRRGGENMSQSQLGDTPPKIEIKKGQYGYYFKLPDDYEISMNAGITRKFASKKNPEKEYIATIAGAFINLNKAKYPAKPREPQ